MKLSELFPDMPKVIIGGAEYEVKFGTRSIIQLENDYPEPDELSSILKNVLTGIKAVDLINVLFAGLLNTKAFKEKEALIDAVEPRDFTDYADAILAAYMRSSVSPEQIEKLEVLAADAKKKAEIGTSQESTLSIE